MERCLLLTLALVMLPAAVACAEEGFRFANLRYGICGVEDRETILENGINVAHTHSPASSWGYDGFPARQVFDPAMRSYQARAEELRAQGVHVLTYIAPDMWYGDDKKRTGFFNFFDERWNDYADFLGERPDDPMRWVQRNAKGEPIVYTYGGRTGYYWCDNDPRARRYVQGLIRMQVAFGSHGVFFDGPMMHGCYCEACAAQFREFLKERYPADVRARILAGADPSTVAPPTGRANLPLYAAWLQFRCDSLTRFLRDMRAYGRSLCPDFLLTNNYCLWSGDAPGVARSIGEHGEQYARAVDVLFDEAAYGAGPLMAEDGARLSNSFHYDYLVAAAGDKPAACTFLGVKGISEAARAPLSWLEIAESWASQCAKMQQDFRNPVAREVFRQANRFQKEHPDLFTPAQPYASVGLWVSLQQALCGQENYGLALARLLQDEGIAYRILTDDDITDKGLKELECVVAANVPAVSAGQAQALERFVRAGKGLVLLGAAATMDECALEWKPADRPAFATLPQPAEAGFAEAALGKGRVLAADLKLFPGLPTYTRTALPQRAAPELARAVRQAAHGRLLVTSAPPPPVECRVYRAGKDRLRVYLVNYGVRKDGTVAGQRDVSVTLSLPARPTVASATAYTGDSAETQPVRLSPGAQPGEAKLTLPELRIWSVVDVRLRP